MSSGFTKLGAKDPNARVAYQIDWTAYFTALGDTLNTATVEVMNAASSAVDPSSDLLIEAQTQTAAGMVTFWVSGGTTGVEYTVRCRVTGVITSPAQTIDEKTVVIPVRQI